MTVDSPWPLCWVAFGLRRKVAAEPILAESHLRAAVSRRLGHSTHHIRREGEGKGYLFKVSLKSGLKKLALSGLSHVLELLF